MNIQGVEVFLNEFLALARVNDIIFFGRDKNLDALLELDITSNRRRDILLELKADDYVDGPLENKSVGMNGDVWVFGKVIRKREVYIKVCINQLANNRGKRSICISFHIAEHPLVYMFKGEGK